MNTYTEFYRAIIEHQTTCLANTEQFIKKIEQHPNKNYYISINSEEALKLSAEADKRFASGNIRPLEGMLIGVKDNLAVKGLKCTNASRILQNYEPIYDATVVHKIKEAGGIIIGKTNMDEFAMGSSNETSYFGGCSNPFNTNYITGGSSGGSAAAVAAGLAHIALGSDTGGSIRQPASFCGVIGFKPTYGSISRYGLTALSSSLDQIGTLSANIEDTSLLFDVISGFDENDSTSAKRPAYNTFSKLTESLPNKFKVGLLPSHILSNCSEDVLNIYENKLEQLKTLGAEFITLNFDFIDVCVPAYMVIAMSEASSNLARLDCIRYGNIENLHNYNNPTDLVAEARGNGFGVEVKRRLLLGTHFLETNNTNKKWTNAHKIRNMIKNETQKAFNQVSLLFLPTTTTTAFKSDDRTDPIAMYMSDFFTISANMAGNPAISIPVGKDANNLPIGMQLQTNLWQEADLFKFAKALL